MSSPIRCSLVQIQIDVPRDLSETALNEFRARHMEKVFSHLERAVEDRSQMICLPELFNCPYFPQEKNRSWLKLAEESTGETIQSLREFAGSRGVVLIVPFFETSAGEYFNSCAVIDGDGKLSGIYRKSHLPFGPNAWEKFYFQPGEGDYPVFETQHSRIAVYICYERYFPEIPIINALKGAQIVFNPSAATGSSVRNWPLTNAFHALTNGFFVGAVNRVGPGIDGQRKFYGSSTFANPNGVIEKTGSPDEEEVVTSDLDLSQIETAREAWPFLRDRRPETYRELCSPDD